MAAAIDAERQAVAEAQQEHARQARVREEVLARQQQQEKEYARGRLEQARWLTQDTEPQGAAESKVMDVWYNYALLPRGSRSTETIMDAFKEAIRSTSGEASVIALNDIFVRRAIADYISRGRGTVSNNDSTILLINQNWDMCIQEAPALLQKMRKWLKDMGFTELLCWKIKRSGVTGNNIVDDEKHWKL